MATQPKTRITDADLLAVGDKVKAEVIDGELIIYPMTPSKAEYGIAGVFLSFILNGFIIPRGLGRVFNDMTAFKMAEDDEGGIKGALVPDVSFVSFDKLPPDADLDVVAHVIPDLCVEVISPGDSFTEVLDKVQLYLDYGVGQVWLLIPRRQEVRCFSPDNPNGTVLGIDDTLEGSGPLAGFAVPVRALFDADPALQAEVVRRLLG